MRQRKKFSVHFLNNFTVDLDKIQFVATACWFMKAHSKFILYNIQGRDLCGCDFIENAFNIVLCWDTSDAACLNLGTD